MLRWVSAVSFVDLHPAMLLAAMRLEKIFSDIEGTGRADLWITSANDSKHMKGSRHYDGKALDFRVHGIPLDRQELIAKRCQAALGAEFFVLLEDSGTPNEHLHVEFVK